MVGGGSGRTILHVTECYEGGVGHAIRSMVVNTPGYRHVLLAMGSDVDADVRDGIYAEVLTLGGTHLDRGRAVKRAAAAVDADVIHAHSSWAGVYSRISTTGRPVVYQPHGYAFEKSGVVSRLAFFTAEKWLARRAARVAVLSAHEEHLARRVHRGSELVRIPNVPTVPMVKRTRWPRRPPEVAMIGRIAEQKDPVFFLAVIARMRLTVPDVRAVWIGDGDQRLRSLLESHGVRVTGWRSSTEVISDIDSADVYVHSARYEGFPLSVLDAAARGLPVLVRDIPAFAQTSLRRSADAKALGDAAVQVLADDAAWQAAHDSTTALLAEMNSASQRAALDRLWRPTVASDG